MNNEQLINQLDEKRQEASRAAVKASMDADFSKEHYALGKSVTYAVAIQQMTKNPYTQRTAEGFRSLAASASVRMQPYRDRDSFNHLKGTRDAYLEIASMLDQANGTGA